MAKTKAIPRPYVDVKHEYAAALKAWEEAGSLLYHSVGTILSLADDMAKNGKSLALEKVLDMLREHHAGYGKAMYGFDDSPF